MIPSRIIPIEAKKMNAQFAQGIVSRSRPRTAAWASRGADLGRVAAIRGSIAGTSITELVAGSTLVIRFFRGALFEVGDGHRAGDGEGRADGDFCRNSLRGRAQSPSARDMNSRGRARESGPTTFRMATGSRY